VYAAIGSDCTIQFHKSSLIALCAPLEQAEGQSLLQIGNTHPQLNFAGSRRRRSKI
jgi:hypothetical protein